MKAVESRLRNELKMADFFLPTELSDALQAGQWSTFRRFIWRFFKAQWQGLGHWPRPSTRVSIGPAVAHTVSSLPRSPRLKVRAARSIDFRLINWQLREWLFHDPVLASRDNVGGAGAVRADLRADKEVSEATHTHTHTLTHTPTWKTHSHKRLRVPY